jgi:hypothetical protein
MHMATCAACGNEGGEGVTFCGHCGQAMDPEGFTAYAMKDPSTGPLFEVRIGDYIKTGWHTFRQYPAGFVGFSLIVATVNGLILLIDYRIQVPVLWYLLTAPIGPLFAGIYVVTAKLLQRRACAFTDFFAGFHYFQPLLIFGLIASLISMGDMLLRYYLLWRHPLLPVLFDLASLAFTLVFLFTPMLVIDRRLRLWEAMGLSRRTVQRRWLSFLGLMLLIGLLASVLGSVAALLVTLVSVAFKFEMADFLTLLFIWVKLTAPIYFIAFTAAYADLFGFQSKEY